MKDLNKENWLQIDPIIASGIFVWMSLADGSVESITADDWVARLVSINLSSKVPEEVRTLFAVARGAMVYGGLFYPLFTLGLEQVLRVAEAGVRAKASAMGLGDKGNFVAILEKLRAQGILSENEHAQWSVVRRFRNATTHSGEQMILPPGVAIGTFASLAKLINRLFDPQEVAC